MKKSKSVLQLFSMHNWCWFEFLTMKKAKGKLKTVYSISSPPYFVTPVSHNDESYLEVISSSRLWFQVFWKYLNFYSYPSNIVFVFCFNFKLQVPKMRKNGKMWIGNVLSKAPKFRLDFVFKINPETKPGTLTLLSFGFWLQHCIQNTILEGFYSVTLSSW